MSIRKAFIIRIIILKHLTILANKTNKVVNNASNEIVDLEFVRQLYVAMPSRLLRTYVFALDLVLIV